MGPYGALWGPMGPYGALWGPMGPYGHQKCQKIKIAKIGPNRVLMVRFDAESPQEFESDAGEARGGHLRLNKPKFHFRIFIFPKNILRLPFDREFDREFDGIDGIGRSSRIRA